MQITNLEKISARTGSRTILFFQVVVCLRALLYASSKLLCTCHCRIWYWKITVFVELMLSCITFLLFSKTFCLFFFVFDLCEDVLVLWGSLVHAHRGWSLQYRPCRARSRTFLRDRSCGRLLGTILRHPGSSNFAGYQYSLAPTAERWHQYAGVQIAIAKTQLCPHTLLQCCGSVEVQRPRPGMILRVPLAEN